MNVMGIKLGSADSLAFSGNYSKSFLRSAGVILIITGAAKILSCLGKERILLIKDPIIRMPYWKLMLVAGILEIAVALLCLSAKVPVWTKAAFVACIASSLLVYRLGLWYVGWHQPCACLGSLAGVLHLSPTAADNSMKAILGFLLVGSYSILLSERNKYSLRGELISSTILCGGKANNK